MNISYFCDQYKTILHQFSSEVKAGRNIPKSELIAKIIEVNKQAEQFIEKLNPDEVALDKKKIFSLNKKLKKISSHLLSTENKEISSKVFNQVKIIEQLNSKLEELLDKTEEKKGGASLLPDFSPPMTRASLLPDFPEDFFSPPSGEKKSYSVLPESCF